MKNIYEEYFYSDDPQEIEREKKKRDALGAILPQLMNAASEKINYVLLNNNKQNKVETEKEENVLSNKGLFNISSADNVIFPKSKQKKKQFVGDNLNLDTKYENNASIQSIKQIKYKTYFGNPKNVHNFDDVFNYKNILKESSKLKSKSVINNDSKQVNKKLDSLWYDNGYLNVTFRNDLLKNDDFSPYRDSDRVGCKRRCVEMLKLSGGELSGARIDMTVNDGNGRPISPSSNFKKGIDAIDKSLNNGKPIILNVDYKEGNASSADKAGDHFIIVVGKTVIDGIAYYHFYDPATKNVNRGTSNRNVLYVKDGYLSGDFVKYNGQANKYKVTSVRLNK